MDFVFDFLFEIIAEAVFECYMAVMYHFFDSNKKVFKNTNILIVFIVIFECLALLLMFVIGAVMSLESGGNSLAGKILLITPVLVSIVQIGAGIILRKKKKSQIKNTGYRRVKSIIRTSLKARIFRAFRRFGLARRQPCFTLSHQKSFALRSKIFYREDF